VSIPVEVDQLAAPIAERGPGYLLTVDGDGRVKAVTVEPELRDGTLLCATSRGSARNLESNPAATLLFPPAEERGYTLLVDGTAVAGDDGIVFTPTSAVLHRPADHAGPDHQHAAGDGCGHDCAPVA
jgi:hypothetical protein